MVNKDFEIFLFAKRNFISFVVFTETKKEFITLLYYWNFYWWSFEILNLLWSQIV